jgi:hypothetical protein
LIVFAIGFVLGTVRVLVVIPCFGETSGVLLELPLMLTAAWFICRKLILRLNVPSNAGDRLIMGGLAFALLMVAEIGVDVVAFGRPLLEHLEAYRSASAALGLAGQIAFGLFPFIQLQRS